MTWGNKKSNKMMIRDTNLESTLNHFRIQTSLGIARRWVSLIHQAYMWKRIERPKGRELIIRKRWSPRVQIQNNVPVSMRKQGFWVCNSVFLLAWLQCLHDEFLKNQGDSWKSKRLIFTQSPYKILREQGSPTLAFGSWCNTSDGQRFFLH